MFKELNERQLVNYKLKKNIERVNKFLIDKNAVVTTVT